MMGQNMLPLNEIVGLPAASAPADIARVSEQRYLALFDQASRGDPQSQRELVSLRLAYLNWAYLGDEARHSRLNPREARA